MDFFSLGALILRSLQIVSNNPAIGGGSTLRTQEISELLGLFGQLFERGDEALEELQEFADIVGAMAAENRNPSRAEWETLRARSDVAHDVIQEAAAEAQAREDAEQDERDRIADEEAEAARQAIAAEIAELEAIPDEDLTEEQRARLELLTSPVLDPNDSEDD